VSGFDGSAVLTRSEGPGAELGSDGPPLVSGSVAAPESGITGLSGSCISSHLARSSRRLPSLDRADKDVRRQFIGDAHPPKWRGCPLRVLCDHHGVFAWRPHGTPPGPMSACPRHV
jgi:hypothetical protein